jgi:hypothetical protein
VRLWQVPILYYDFENNTTRTAFENTVEQAMVGSGSVSRESGGPAITGATGAGIFNGGADGGPGALDADLVDRRRGSRHRRGQLLPIRGQHRRPGGPLGHVRAVPLPARIRLSVMDVQGREVVVLLDGESRPGRFQATWNGRTEHGNAPSGLYFIRLRTPGKDLVRRLALSR